ncbi:MAG: 16S rRNA (cytosine(1402)-N(4))-methyltransferase RsmH [Cardiobacteriaceae bacterium]|nr:16S rRNA (cytosine(1402)-N(4))-methyltransferase RsmH [Cardiobacteriaceae bacterium]
MSTPHVSVLLEESVAALDIREDGVYLDGTFGRGGHSRAILAALGAEGRLYALDRDPQAAEAAATIHDPRFRFAKSPFSALDSAFAEVGEASLDGVLFDLGVSSPQLDQGERGFSFLHEGPIDMRMDPESGMSARDWLLATDVATLARAIRDLGGEPHTVAKRIAEAVMAKRERLTTTTELAAVIAEAMPKKFHRPGYHPATQTFQAIRMVVNDEVGEIERGLAAATRCLKSGGVLAVITFHGLEDALVKRFVRSREGEELPAEIPSEKGRMNQVLRLVRPVIKPSVEAIAANPRCRSARLRKAVKI